MEKTFVVRGIIDGETWEKSHCRTIDEARFHYARMEREFETVTIVERVERVIRL